MKLLITGTSKGLGYGLAKKYLHDGHTVYGISRTQNSDFVNETNFKFLALDISRFDELKLKLTGFLQAENELDLVILNAGILNELKDLFQTPLEEIEKVMNVNVWANKVIIDTLYRSIENIGQIVGISSGASVSGSRGWNAYSLSKATLNMLLNLYAKEFTETHFCALAPGLVDTAMQDYITGLPEEINLPTVKRLKSAKALGEIPTVEAAAEIVSKAISKVRSFETGRFVDVRKLD